MVELSDLCEELAPRLGVPASELAEIRRRLREQSESEELIGKRGRAGGLPATPFNVGFVVVALMVDSPTRAEAAKATWSVWHLNQEGSVLSGWGEDFQPKLARCPLTGAHLFGDAFKAILSNPSLAKRVQDVRVSEKSAEIRYLAQQKRFARAPKASSKVSKFEGRGGRSSFLHREAILDGRVVRMIAGKLNAEAL